MGFIIILERSMSMIFHSKKDLWLGLFIWITIGGGFIIPLLTAATIVRVVMSIIIFFVAWIWFGTDYQVSEGTLKVRSGPFKWNIVISEIKSIKKTRNPLSSAALSLDRLEVRYGHSSMILISPKEKERFIDVITSINPNIKVIE